MSIMKSKLLPIVNRSKQLAFIICAHISFCYAAGDDIPAGPLAVFQMFLLLHRMIDCS